jgi:hypothetical protein
MPPPFQGGGFRLQTRIRYSTSPDPSNLGGEGVLFALSRKKEPKTACLFEGSAPFRGDDDCKVRAYLPLVISSEVEKYERPGVWERGPRQAEPNFSLVRSEDNQSRSY